MIMADLHSVDGFVDLTDGEIQDFIDTVLKSIDEKDLVLVLWAASEEVKDKFLRNMTGELLTFVKDELAFLDPIAPWCRPESNPDIPRLHSFDDLLKLTDREIQAGLREIDQYDLVVALKQASEKVKEKVLSNLSKRVRTFLEERLEASESIVPEDFVYSNGKRRVEDTTDPVPDGAEVQKKILEITATEAEKVVEKARNGIVAVREQMIQVYQLQKR
jgi:hypothetical protein